MSTVQERVIAVIAEQLGQLPSSIQPSTTKDDLCMDSLDDVEAVMALEDEFEREVSDDTAEQWKSIQDVITYFESVTK